MARPTGPNVGLLAQMLQHFRDRMMMVNLVVIPMVMVGLLLVDARRQRQVAAAVEATLGEAGRELPGKTAIVKPVAMSEVAVLLVPVVGSVGVLVQREEGLIALEEHISVVIRGYCCTVRLVIPAGVGKILVVRFVLVDIVEVVREKSHVVVMHGRRASAFQGTSSTRYISLGHHFDTGSSEIQTRPSIGRLSVPRCGYF